MTSGDTVLRPTHVVQAPGQAVSMAGAGAPAVAAGSGRAAAPMTTVILKT